ncbi:unnamed protein product, partial [Linum tenue]
LCCRRSFSSLDRRLRRWREASTASTATVAACKHRDGDGKTPAMPRTKEQAAMRPLTGGETSRPKRTKQQQQEEEEEFDFVDDEIEHEDDDGQSHEDEDGEDEDGEDEDGEDEDGEDEDGEDEENAEKAGGRQYRFRCTTKKVLSIIKDWKQDPRYYEACKREIEKAGFGGLFELRLVDVPKQMLPTLMAHYD